MLALLLLELFPASEITIEQPLKLSTKYYLCNLCYHRKNILYISRLKHPNSPNKNKTTIKTSQTHLNSTHTCVCVQPTLPRYPLPVPHPPHNDSSYKRVFRIIAHPIHPSTPPAAVPTPLPIEIHWPRHNMIPSPIFSNLLYSFPLYSVMYCIRYEPIPMSPFDPMVMPVEQVRKTKQKSCRRAYV